MSVAYVIQARMGSTRLPGKVLADLGGRPLLAFMLERLSGLQDGPVIVATSDLERDDPVAEVAAGSGADVIRGDEGDVLSRYMLALERFPADVVVRLTADCPFADVELIRAAVELRERTQADHASNALVRTFPDGLDVEAVSANALHAAAAEAQAGVEREHVTPFIYRHPECFHLVNLRNDEDLSRERWTVDLAEDLEFVRAAVSRFEGRSDFGWREVLEVVGRRSSSEPGELHLRPAMPEDSNLLLRWRNDPESVATSGTGQPVEPEDHATWYEGKLFDGGSHLLIGELDGREVGYVRVDVEAAVGKLSLIVAPEDRGLGFATRLFVLVQQHVQSGCQVDALEADVHRDNIGSLRALEKTGFRVVSRGTFHHLRWTPS